MKGRAKRQKLWFSFNPVKAFKAIKVEPFVLLQYFEVVALRVTVKR